ncbi:MAG: HAD family phosphatase [Anaerolineae bacterium]|jgi:HAD superfamily hydrolase (TIGR01509 family)
MTWQGVLWDMDGVLVDTGQAHFQSWVDVLSEYDIPFSREFFRDTFGMNNAGILSILLGDRLTPELLDEIADRKETLFREAVRGSVEPMPGVIPWLERLQEAGFRQGIASSAPVANIDTLVDELGVRTSFDVIVSGVDLPGKPEPVLFLKVADMLHVLPERCVVVEDAVAGVEAAKRAGMGCIAVTTTSPASALGAADIVVDRLDDLPQDTFQRLLSGAKFV